MLILTDVDGVLLNWIDSFHNWMRSQDFTLKHNDCYDLATCYDLSPELINNVLIEQFNASAEMGFLHPLGDAVAQVKKLHDDYGVVFHAITSMGSNESARRLRKMNLRRIFGANVFQSISILGCGEDKTDALSQFANSGLFWLEDHIDNAVVGHELGLKSILFNRSYNADRLPTEDFLRVNTWKDFVKIVDFKQKTNSYHESRKTK